MGQQAIEASRQGLSPRRRGNPLAAEMEERDLWSIPA